MNHPIRTFLIAVLCCGGPALAAPTTRPTSPEEFQRIYTDALNAQDAALVRSLFLAGTPGQRAVAEVFVDQELATAKLAKAIEKAFGVPLWGGGELVPADPAQWRIEGDHAVAVREALPGPVSLIQGADGAWKIDLWWRGIDPADKAEKSRQEHQLARLHAVIRDVEAGEFRSIRAADIAAVVSGPALEPRPGAPATRPAQQPGTRPVKVDLSSPRACIETHGRAIMQGDAAAILRTLHWADAQQEEYAKALAEWASVSAHFNVAAARRFGTQAAEELRMPILDVYYGGLGLVYPAQGFDEFDIKGNEASWDRVAYGDYGSGQFIRIGEEWKMRALPKDRRFEKDLLDDARICRIAAVFRRSQADRIESGELKNVDEVWREGKAFINDPRFQAEDR